jgi:uncharacterized protein YutE (UPF0331/DUF86 family)
MNEIILSKKTSIEGCIKQINQYYALASDLPFESDYLKQDAIAMNLQRASELTIDIANHLIKTKKLGLPQDSKESFSLLQSAGLIDTPMMENLHGIVGFRNILVDVIEHHLGELLDFANLALDLAD